MKTEEDRFSWERKETRQSQEAALEGIHVLRTDVSAETLGAEAVVIAYEHLSRIERGCRCHIEVDLLVRPANHRPGNRVRARIFLCMLPYYVEWHMRGPLAPLPFQDDDRDGAERRRGSVVGQAKRSG